MQTPSFKQNCCFVCLGSAPLEAVSLPNEPAQTCAGHRCRAHCPALLPALCGMQPADARSVAGLQQKVGTEERSKRAVRLGASR